MVMHIYVLMLWLPEATILNALVTPFIHWYYEVLDVY